MHIFAVTTYEDRDFRISAKFHSICGNTRFEANVVRLTALIEIPITFVLNVIDKVLCNKFRVLKSADSTKTRHGLSRISSAFRLCSISLSYCTLCNSRFSSYCCFC